jgi:hypothetical protein
MHVTRISAGVSLAAAFGSLYFGYQTIKDTAAESGEIATNVARELTPDAVKELGGLAGKVLGRDTKETPPPEPKATPESKTEHFVKVVTWQETIAPKILPETVSNDVVASAELGVLALGALGVCVGSMVNKGRRETEPREDHESDEDYEFYRDFYYRYSHVIEKLEDRRAEREAQERGYPGPGY